MLRPHAERTGSEQRAPTPAASVLPNVLPLRGFCCASCVRRARDVLQKAQEIWALLVPDERFELPTNGLQNRCSTTELIRHYANRYGHFLKDQPTRKAHSSTIFLPFATERPVYGS